MAKINLSKFQKRVEKQLKSVVSQNNMKQFAALALELIKKRSRKGLGVVGGNKGKGRTKPFPSPLSPSYVAQRRRSRLSPYTSPTKSNITFSGRMLASLRVTTKEGFVSVSPTGVSRGGVPNSKIAEYLVDMDRTFLALTKEEFDKLVSLLKRKIKESARR